MSKKPTKEDKEKKAQVWAERYTIAVKNQEGMFARFAKWFDLMHANVNDENIAQWRSKVFIPVLAGKAWNLIAKFVGLKPGFEVTLRDPDPMPEIPEEIEDDPLLKEEYYKAENERIQSLRDRAEKMQRKLEFNNIFVLSCQSAKCSTAKCSRIHFLRPLFPNMSTICETKLLGLQRAPSRTVSIRAVAG